MKRVLSIALATTFIMSSSTMAFAAENGIKTVKSSSNIIVDGENMAFEAYNINNSNYFKLRDISKALKESDSKFEVTWDESKNAINLITGGSYKEADEDVSPSITGKLTVKPSTSDVYVDGTQVDIKAYNINGSNYFKLRDLGESTMFNIGWDGARNSILIDTKGELVEPVAPVETKPAISTGGQSYTFSKTKMGYLYNIYVEGKGYMNFGNDKPFVENGIFYLPVEHIAKFAGRELVWDSENNEFSIDKYYTEETNPDKNDDFIYGYDNGKPIYYGYDQYKNPIVKERRYLNNFKIKISEESNIAIFDSAYIPTKWAIDFANSGGKYITFDGLEDNLYEPFYRASTLTMNSKVIVKNGKPYLGKDELMDILALSLFNDAPNKTYHSGSDSYKNSLATKVVEDKKLSNGQTYQEMMNDVFKNAKPIEAWQYQ